MRVLIIYDVPGWAYHNRAMALQDNAPDDIEVTIACHAERHIVETWETAFDLVFQLDYSAVIATQRSHPGPPVVASFNSDENRRHNMFRSVRHHADFVICNNLGRWNHEGRPQRSCNISNGVDTDFWRPTRDPLVRQPRLLWCGSNGKNKPKGWNEVIAPMENEAKRRGWQTSFRVTMQVEDSYSREDQLAWYNTGAIILCASASDATPNTTLEGMSCGCIPVSTWIGNIREFGKHGENCFIADRTPEAFLDACEQALEERHWMESEVRNTMLAGWDWKDRSKYFWALFRKIAEDGPASVEPFTYAEKHWSEI